MRLETAVRRCSQKCPEPDLAEPRPRTLASGVRKAILQPLLEEDGGPDRQGQGSRAEDRQPREDVDLPDLQAPPRIPDQVAHGAEPVKIGRAACRTRT